MDITLEKLLEAGAHFGHHARRWNPKMAEYLYGVVEGVHVFDLVKTRALLLEALDVLQKAVAEGKVILFVGTKKQAKDKLKEICEKNKVPYVTERWLGGTLTNFEQLAKSVKNLADMKQKREAGEYASFTKKERLLINRKIEKLERFFSGVASLTKPPDLIVIIDTHHEIGAVREAKRLSIPTIGVVDSNADPTEVSYPIPMNDDASASVNLILDLFDETLQSKVKPAVKKTKKNAKKNNSATNK